MAITRAQQYRQMLKDGNFVMQGGVRNYLPSEMVTVPKKAKSSKDHPATQLAYITKAEKDLLIKKDIHNSLNGKVNKGPGGVMSLNGGFGEEGGFQSGGNQSAAESGDSGAFGEGADNKREAESVRAGAVAAGARGRDTDTDAIRKEAEKIKAERQREAAKQKADKEAAKEAKKFINNRKKEDNKKRRDRINNILSGKFGVNNPYGLSPRELEDLKSLGIDPNKAGPMTDMQQDIFDQMMEKNDRFSGVNLENFQNKFDLPKTGITSLDLVTGLLEGPLSKGSKRTKEFFTDDVLGASKFKYDGNVVNPEIFSMLNPTEMQEIYGDYMGKRMSGETDAYGNPTNLNTGGGGGDNNQTYVPPIIPEDDTTEEEVVPPRNLGGIAPRFAGSIFDFTGLADGGIARAGAMDGGRMMMMANEEEDDPTGGIMDLESGRQMYFLGKLVKKATRAVKKVAKSPLGKAALLGAIGFGIPGTSLGGIFGRASFGGAAPGMFGFGGIKNAALLGKNKLFGEAIMKQGTKQVSKGLLSSPFGLIAGGSLLAGALTPKEEEEKFDNYYASNNIDYGNVRNNPFKFLSAANQGSRYNSADGGLMRTGYAEGSEEPVAKKTMPLLDMDGQEMDLREEGGFVPLGRMERADDVPARLSKNEFVFTADAVRNAGEGDIDKGAEVMYNMMKNLESGGEVSEESQGLEGAREMFKTSQRLEEVI